MLSLFLTNIAYADEVDVFIGNVNRVILNPIIYLLFALAFVFFVYGVLEFLMNQENDEKKTIGKSHMIWGIIGITIMFGVWALLNIILGTLGITGIDPESGTVELNDYNPDFPSLNSSGNSSSSSNSGSTGIVQPGTYGSTGTNTGGPIKNGPVNNFGGGGYTPPIQTGPGGAPLEEF